MIGAATRSRVLVVDDDEILLALVRVTLDKECIEVLTATRGEEALALVAAEQPDVVILDVAISGMSGWEILRRLRGVDDVPVLILSARDSEVDIARGLDLGADDYLTKPFSLVEFEARVNALLRRRAWSKRGMRAAAA